MRALLRTVEVRHSAAMFKDEREVVVQSQERRHSLLTHALNIKDGLLFVDVLERNGDTALVELPNETWTAGRRLWVKRADLVPSLELVR